MDISFQIVDVRPGLAVNGDNLSDDAWVMTDPAGIASKAEKLLYEKGFEIGITWSYPWCNIVAGQRKRISSRQSPEAVLAG